MFRERKWLVGICILVVLATLAACGPTPTPQVIKEKETVVVPVKETVTVKETVVVPQEKTTVTIAYNQYFNMTFGPADPPIVAIKKAVEAKYPDIKVELLVTSTEAKTWHDMYTTWFMAKDPTVDILGVGGYWTAEFAEAGWLEPLNDGVAPDVDPKITAKLIPAYLEAHTYKGKLMGLGPWWGGIGGLYYRKDLLEKYGFKPPQTYDDVVTISKAIMAKEPGMTGWTWSGKKDVALVNRWFEYLYGFGGKYFDDAGKCAMNSPQAQAALEYMVNLIKEGISPAEVATWKEEDSMVRFVSGQAIFHTGRQDMLFWLDNPEKSKVVGKWGFIPNPAQPGGRRSGTYEGWAFAISKFSDSKDAALKVLEVMFDFPVQKQLNLSQGPVQAHMDVYTDPDVIKNNPNMPLIEEIAKTALAPLSSPQYPEIADILAEEIHAAITGLKAPKAALNDACARIDLATGH